MVHSVPARPAARFHLPVAAPFRLDLTVAALRRLPANRVDVFDGERYLRAFSAPRGPVVWSIQYEGDDHLDVRLYGAVDEARSYLALVERMLAPSFDLGPFYRRAASGPELLASLVDRFRGLKPPRFGSLWESVLHAIPFQQLSLKSAMTVLGRRIEASSEPVEFEGRVLYPVPGPDRLLSLPAERIRATGLSGAKARALREAAKAIAGGTLDEISLEALDSSALAKKLRSLRGIGRWTAELILLRGFRRLDTFPTRDAGAAASLRSVLPGLDPAGLLRQLGPFRGMLYDHLLLARGLSP